MKEVLMLQHQLVNLVDGEVEVNLVGINSYRLKVSGCVGSVMSVSFHFNVF
jgi:hypothetical protein